ncbi:MAG TPA: S41 family peptidase [Parachlamydiaceae bacterium]|nr:S41 family peptidase [Parachlamydiaceae bacterium]
MLIRFIALLLFICANTIAEGKIPELSPRIVNVKMQEIMKAHAKYKKLSPELMKRILANYLEELDPAKSYFIESDIHEWQEPSEKYLESLVQSYNSSNFKEFERIHDTLAKAIERRHLLEKQINLADLPKHVDTKEFKDMKWKDTEQELLTRIIRIKALQLEAANKLSEDLKDKSLQRIGKRQAKFEEEILNPSALQKQNLILSNVLKASASALDAHTAYFTPDEASQFLINVQQRLFGIGAQLRDDINGFTVVKVIEGGPAAMEKKLKAKDRIIAVNGEPVVGMDITEAVELIRGEENTPVTLTVIREKEGENDEKPHDEKLDIVINRGEVVLKETRYEDTYEPFGDGAIAYLRLHSFYQDPDSSSAQDLEKAFSLLKDGHKIKGLILDLRSNAGGLLSQAVDVAGLFISKGIVVSIKDEFGQVQHLRDLGSKMIFDGPLIVLINKGSASASEIVAQSLQDYGRALVVGDENSYGKGSFQTFTLNTDKNNLLNPQGEYKVTRGVYYTVSGKTPQKLGVLSDIKVPGSLSEAEIGEKYNKYALDNESIKENFDDDLSDIPSSQRDKIRLLYKFNLQQKQNLYGKYLPILKTNSTYRIEHNKNYQNFLKDLKKTELPTEEEEEQYGQNDLQLTETYNIMKDLILMMQSNSD